MANEAEEIVQFLLVLSGAFVDFICITVYIDACKNGVLIGKTCRAEERYGYCDEILLS